MGEKVAEPLGSRGCDQGYKGQLVAGYSWHPSEISAKPMVFNIPVKDLEDGIECTYSKAVDGTNLGGGAHALVGRAAIDRVLERLKKCTVSNSVKSRCKRLLLRLGWRYSV